MICLLGGGGGFRLLSSIRVCSVYFVLGGSHTRSMSGAARNFMPPLWRDLCCCPAGNKLKIRCVVLNLMVAINMTKAW